MIRKGRTAAMVLLLAAATAWAQEKYTLRRTCSPGAYDAKMSMKSEGHVDVSVGATSQPTTGQKRTVEMSASMVVGPADPFGLKKVSFAYRRFLLDTTAGDDSIRYDSDAPEEDANTAAGKLAAVIKPMLAAKFSFELAADGNLRTVKGPA